MVRTHGLTHINLAVRDLDRSLRFYVEAFGYREYYRDDASVQAQGPGKDILALELAPESAGKLGGLSHFGFRLIEPTDIDTAVAEAVRAGGTLLRRGEFAPGFPFAYVADPDGYEVEIWFE